MIKRSPAFTLMEVILAIALSSTVLVFLARAMGNFYRISRLANEKMSVSRQLLLTFDVLEKDISSAFLLDDSKNDKKKEDDSSASKQAQDDIDGFILQAKKRRFITVEKKTIRRFKSLSFITTHAFSIPNQSPIVPVRVRYELVKEKKRDQVEKSYRLVRVQTIAFNSKEKSAELRMTILENIKQLSMWVPGELELEEKHNKNNIELVPHRKKRGTKLFNWGGDDETLHTLPISIKFYIELWNNDYSDVYNKQGFGFEIPIISWDEELERRKKKYQENKRKGSEHNES